MIRDYLEVVVNISVARIPLVTCDQHEFDRLQEAKELDFVWIR